MKRSAEHLYAPTFNNQLNSESSTPNTSNQSQTLFPTFDKDQPVFLGHTSMKRRNIRAEYTIHTIQTFHTIVDDFFKNHSNKEKCKVRFLISNNYELLFAPEGTPNSTVPAHYQMTGAQLQSNASCITAGNFKINKNKEIVLVNHKSGDFRPTFNSLQWAFAVCFANDVKFAETITIVQLGDRGEKLRSNEGIIRTELSKQIYTNFSDDFFAKFKAANTNISPKTYVYGTSALESRPTDQSSPYKGQCINTHFDSPKLEGGVKKSKTQLSNRLSKSFFFADAPTEESNGLDKLTTWDLENRENSPPSSNQQSKLKTKQKRLNFEMEFVSGLCNP